MTPLSSAFQRVLSSIFADLPYVVVYIDNIYVISVTLEEHSVHLVVVLERLNLWVLRLNLIKCRFCILEVEVLGYEVSPDGLSLDRAKVADLPNVPVPITGKQVSAFLGFCNFFRRFVPAFATISAPLVALRLVEHVVLNPEATSGVREIEEYAAECAFARFSRLFSTFWDGCRCIWLRSGCGAAAAASWYVRMERYSRYILPSHCVLFACIVQV